MPYYPAETSSGKVVKPAIVATRGKVNFPFKTDRFQPTFAIYA